LGKFYKKDDFDSLKRGYQEYILKDEHSDEFKQKMLRYFDNTVAYLKQQHRY
jgi:hypothetical protein